jgi:hypothetical protein
MTTQDKIAIIAIWVIGFSTMWTLFQLTHAVQ